MIYSTNRTTSLGDMTVDVNESYFGVGALSFMQENAQDELALFEAAIRSDIDEVLIGESVTELEALNEGFVNSAVNKIKEMMRKFIEWLKAVTRSAYAKLTQLLVRDNEKFIKIATKQLSTMKNYKNFKYSGKALKFPKNTDTETPLSKVNGIKDIYNTVKKESSKEKIEELKGEAETLVKEFNELDVRKQFQETCVEDVTDEGIDLVQKHLDILKDKTKKDLKKNKKTLIDLENDAKKIAKEAEQAVKNEKDEDAKAKLSALASIANMYKSCAQKHVSDELYLTKQNAKIARAVVAKAMGATPKNEGAEYDEELINAMIESIDYEYDEALEEMSDGKECKDCDDDIEDDEE